MAFLEAGLGEWQAHGGQYSSPPHGLIIGPNKMGGILCSPGQACRLLHLSRGLCRVGGSCRKGARIINGWRSAVWRFTCSCIGSRCWLIRGYSGWTSLVWLGVQDATAHAAGRPGQDGLLRAVVALWAFLKAAPSHHPSDLFQPMQSAEVKQGCSRVPLRCGKQLHLAARSDDQRMTCQQENTVIAAQGPWRCPEDCMRRYIM